MPLPTIPEYSSSIRTPGLIIPDILRGGHPLKKGERIIKYSGGFCVVFPFVTSKKKYAVRCWHAEIQDAKKRTKKIADALKSCQLPYFVGFEYYENGITMQQGKQPIVVMDWIDAKPLKNFIGENINNAHKILTIAENFKKMVADLHQNHLSHGDLQHGNILVKEDCSLVLVDYDSMYVPALKGMSDDIKGLPGYQHESRIKNKYLTEKADYFSELIIYLSLKALAKHHELWRMLNIENTETFLFTEKDLSSKGTAPIFDKLRNDPELAPLVEKLCDFLKKRSIEELQPLEIAISTGVNHPQPIANTPAQSKIPQKTIIEKIATGWEKGNGYSPKKEEAKRKDKSEQIVKKITEEFRSPQ